MLLKGFLEGSSKEIKTSSYVYKPLDGPCLQVIQKCFNAFPSTTNCFFYPFNKKKLAAFPLFFQLMP
jgi:hypothetical protein